jgi:hypothetical protein
MLMSTSAIMLSIFTVALTSIGAFTLTRPLSVLDAVFEVDPFSVEFEVEVCSVPVSVLPLVLPSTVSLV